MAKIKDWLKGIEYTVITGTDEENVSSFSADSRKLSKGTAFLCIKGSVTDSHDYILDAVDKEVKVIIVEKEIKDLPVTESEARDKNLTIIKTNDSREAMAYLSSAYFNHPSEKLKMIGITGTKGKTSTSYIIKNILEKNGHKTGVIGTNGCVIGGTHYETRNTTPDSFELNERFSQMVSAGCEYCIMECSSQGFKLHRTDGIKFTYGLFLNISPDHIGPLEHADFDEYLSCKACLLKQSETVILSGSDENAVKVLNSAGKKIKKLILFTEKGKETVNKETAEKYSEEWTLLNSDDYKYIRNALFTGTEFSVSGFKKASFGFSMPGDYNVLNATAAAALAFSENIPAEGIDEALRSVNVPGRTQTVLKTDKYTVIVDYAHNEISMEKLMETLSHYEHKRLVAVFGCGGNRSKDRRVGMGETAAKTLDFSIFTADNSRNEKTEDIIKDIENAYLAAGGSVDKYICIPDRREAIYYAVKNAKDGDIIAVIGKGHEDYQEENGVRKHFLDSEEIIKAKERIDNEN